MSADVATTQWSQVLAARDGSDTAAREALEGLCQTYWEPLYAYLLARGIEPEAAKDLTQAYFTELLEKEFLSQVDPSKGRFRAFLLASLRHFLSHERDRAGALKRGGGALTLSLDVDTGERGYDALPVDDTTPEEIFDHRWAMTVLERALVRLGEECDAEQFEQLKPYLTGGDGASYKTMAERMGMSEGGVKSAVHRLRRRMGDCLRAEISQTVADPSEVDEEVRHLLMVLRRH